MVDNNSAERRQAMKTHSLLDTVLLFLTLSLVFKIFITMARLCSVNLSAITLPAEFQYLTTLLF